MIKLLTIIMCYGVFVLIFYAVLATLGIHSVDDFREDAQLIKELYYTVFGHESPKYIVMLMLAVGVSLMPISYMMFGINEVITKLKKK